MPTYKLTKVAARRWNGHWVSAVWRVDTCTDTGAVTRSTTFETELDAQTFITIETTENKEQE